MLNEIDKLKIIIPKTQVKCEVQTHKYALGCMYRQLKDNLSLEVSGKIFATSQDLGSITKENIHDLPKILKDRLNLDIDEYFLLYEALIGRVDVKKDLFLDELPRYYLSALKEKFKSCTYEFDVYKYDKIKYINGLRLVPKAKSKALSIVCYSKFDEVYSNRKSDYGYYDLFDFEYLEKLKNVIRTEIQLKNFKEIRQAFDLEFDEEPTIINIFSSDTDVVSEKMQQLLT